MKTFSPKPTDYQRAWWVLDADGQVLGRLAVEAARLLRGKHKPVFAPHADTGDYVIVVNAKGVRLTGKKLEQKMHRRHSGSVRPDPEVAAAWAEHGKVDRYMTLRQVRAVCARVLPGAEIRRHLFWRYSLVWRKPN